MNNMLHTCGGSVVIDNLTDSVPESIDILTINSNDLQAMALERLLDIESFEVLGRMTRNSNIIVINQDLDVQVLGNGQACSFSIVAFLLGAIRAEAENGLISVGEGNSVDHGPVECVIISSQCCLAHVPDMAQASG